MSSQRYRIIERLDKGGMAEVFRGVSESMGGEFRRTVAIKRVLPSLAENEKFVGMFLDEARLSLMLQHANIVQVYDIGKTENTYFLVMEYVDGANLKKVIDFADARGRLVPEEVVIYIMIEACKALEYAHNLTHPETMEPLEIVHRDISPPNILMSKNGEVKVVDFGLAKAGSQVVITDPGVVKGKFSYLSPEAAYGHPVDRRADVFAIGILLWEMFTGRRLFLGDTEYQTVELVRAARVPSIGALNPQIDGELEAVVRGALARDPRERYQSAAELGDALAHYLFGHGRKVTARQVAELIREVRGITKRRATTSTGALVDALLQEEMERLTSITDDDEVVTPPPAPHSPPAEAEAGEYEDVGSWIDEFDLD
jgi:eukaryotic-like serine/threonine-protein kinase